MMKLFSERTGIRYPYAKYSQAVVQDFIFGGMENVSATTVTDLILFDQRARLETWTATTFWRTRSRTSGSATC